VQLLNAHGPVIFGLGEFRLYRHQRSARLLHRVRTAADPAAETISLAQPGDTAIAAAFSEREMTVVGDRVLLPLLANGEAIGLVEMRGRLESPLARMLVSHLGAVMGTALKVQEQQHVREHLRRSEQLAMAGQLLSAIALELREPLDEILAQANQLLARQPDSLTAQELGRIVAHARQSTETVERLIGFARTDRTEVTTFDLNALLHSLLQLRDPAYRTRGITVGTQFNREPVYIEGVRAQLEEAFLQLLFQAEQVASQISIQTQSAGGRALIHIQFAGAGTGPELTLCRSLLQAHGGELESNDEGYSVQLPESRPPVQRSQAKGIAVRHMTILLIEPEETSRRKLLTELGEEGHRVVPVSSAEEGIDLIRRIRFDIAFCSARLPGLKWVDFYEAARAELGSFVLLTEGFDTSLRDSGARLLRKPIHSDDLLALLESLAEPVPVA
jgi:signal transduction histidine kinase